MNKNILRFICIIEGWKTAIKNLHWSSDNMSEHKLFDDIADSVADFQDTISEIEQGMNGNIALNQLHAVKYNIKDAKTFLKDVLRVTNSFYKSLRQPEYAGMRSEVETFIGDVQKFQYLLKLALGETKRTTKFITESQLRGIIMETVRRILT